MVSETTIKFSSDKCVPMKPTRYENVCESVRLVDILDGTKVKLFFVFGAAKRESNSLDDEYKG